MSFTEPLIIASSIYHIAKLQNIKASNKSKISKTRSLLSKPDVYVSKFAVISLVIFFFSLSLIFGYLT